MMKQYALNAKNFWIVDEEHNCFYNLIQVEKAAFEVIEYATITNIRNNIYDQKQIVDIFENLENLSLKQVLKQLQKYKIISKKIKVEI